MKLYESVEDIKDANRRAGQHFFDPDAMRFFRSRIGTNVFGGRFFVTSEQFVMTMSGYAEPRRYTVRQAMPDGSIGEGSAFQEFATRAEANRAASRMAQQIPVFGWHPRENYGRLSHRDELAPEWEEWSTSIGLWEGCDRFGWTIAGKWGRELPEELRTKEAVTV